MKTQLNATVWLMLVGLMTATVLGQSNVSSVVSSKDVTISGNVGAPDVRISGFPMDVVSTASGDYRVVVPYRWSGTATPRKDGMQFEPPSLSFDNVTKNMDHMNFHARMPAPVVPSANQEVLVVPTTEVKVEQFSAIQQDMRVMLHILKKAVQDEKNPLVGGVFSPYGNLPGRNSQSLQSLYIQGYGALFFL